MAIQAAWLNQGVAPPELDQSRLVRVLTHLHSFRTLYAIIGGWVVLLLVLGGASGTGQHRAATSAAPAVADATAVAPAAASTGGAAPAGGPATAGAADSSASLPTALGTTSDTAGSDSSVVAATPADPAYGPVATGPAGSSGGPSAGSPSSGSPSAGPPTCTADASLPAPVAATAVGGLATTETTVAQSSGQSLPADPAATAGSVAGCSPAAAPAPPSAQSATWWPAGLMAVRW